MTSRKIGKHGSRLLTQSGPLWFRKKGSFIKGLDRTENSRFREPTLRDGIINGSTSTWFWT